MTVAPPPAPVLELDQVSKAYAGVPPVRALDQVSLAVKAGELVAVVGPSGSGKTTLLHLMGTLDRPISGTVRITGRDVAALPDRQLGGAAAARIGFVFQQFFLAEHKSAVDNVADGLLYAGVPPAGARRAAALDRVGLGTAPRRRPPSCPVANASGWRSRGRWSASPAIVLADGPTGNLDTGTGASMLALLEELNGGTTIIMITHDRAVAVRNPAARRDARRARSSPDTALFRRRKARHDRHPSSRLSAPVRLRAA